MTALAEHLLQRLRQVQAQLGVEQCATDSNARFADEVDSMGFAEYLAIVADDCAVEVEDISRAVGREYGTVEELADALTAAGVHLQRGYVSLPAVADFPSRRDMTLGWVSGVTAQLPEHVEPAACLNLTLGRPGDWLQTHAGISQRRVWLEQDPLAAAATAGKLCLERSATRTENVGALLVTSEAPPHLTGLAAAVHDALDLDAATPALEMGGACTGFLTALWTASRLLASVDPVLIVGVEAASRWLAVEPGPAGEAAAFFGDAAAACLVSTAPLGHAPLRLRDIALGVDGASRLVGATVNNRGRVELAMDGPALASRAARAMAISVRTLAARHRLQAADLAAIIVHGGNGRFPDLIARQLGIDPAKVKSETPRTGNLGSLSLPVAWAALAAPVRGPVAWTAAGAGLQWGSALFDAP